MKKIECAICGKNKREKIKIGEKYYCIKCVKKAGREVGI